MELLVLVPLAMLIGALSGLGIAGQTLRGVGGDP
jgi:hypothetical protein